MSLIRLKIYIRAVLTYVEYDAGKGKEYAMQNLNADKIGEAWSSLAGAVFLPHTEEEYRRLVALPDGLIDEVGEDEAHPFASRMEIVGILLEKYEDELAGVDG